MEYMPDIYISKQSFNYALDLVKCVTEVTQRLDVDVDVDFCNRSHHLDLIFLITDRPFGFLVVGRGWFFPTE